MKTIADILKERPKLSEAETKKALEEYEDLIYRAANMCYDKSIKKRYFKMHGRVDFVFQGEKAEVVLHWLRYAVHRSESEKEWPQGKRFNYELKTVKESRAAANKQESLPSVPQADT